MKHVQPGDIVCRTPLFAKHTVITLSSTLIALVAAAAAYLIGSVSTAVIVCRMMGLGDPRQAGSGNPGATNVLRLGGKFPAALTLLGDALKGFLPVVVTWLIVKHPPTVALVALAAFLGHLYPVFFDFRGGKGVATALGALLGISGATGALALLTWLACSLTFRKSSLAALITFALIPIYLTMTGETVYTVAFLVIGALIFYCHRDNIKRIMAGTEPKIGDKKKH